MKLSLLLLLAVAAAVAVTAAPDCDTLHSELTLLRDPSLENTYALTFALHDPHFVPDWVDVHLSNGHAKQQANIRLASSMNRSEGMSRASQL